MLHVSTENVWKDALIFYKSNMGNKEKLLRKLNVCFNDEVGIDGGALKVEFFTLIFRKAKEELFEPL